MPAQRAARTPATEFDPLTCCRLWAGDELRWSTFAVAKASGMTRTTPFDPYAREKGNGLLNRVYRVLRHLDPGQVVATDDDVLLTTGQLDRVTAYLAENCPEAAVICAACIRYARAYEAGADTPALEVPDPGHQSPWDPDVVAGLLVAGGRTRFPASTVSEVLRRVIAGENHLSVAARCGVSQPTVSKLYRAAVALGDTLPVHAEPDPAVAEELAGLREGVARMPWTINSRINEVSQELRTEMSGRFAEQGSRCADRDRAREDDLRRLVAQAQDQVVNALAGTLARLCGPGAEQVVFEEWSTVLQVTAAGDTAPQAHGPRRGRVRRGRGR